MRTPQKLRFQMLTAEAQQTLSTFEHIVIILMVLIAVASIIWSVSLHIVSGDFNHAIFGAKVTFKQRDFSRLSERAKELHQRDLNELYEEIYDVDVMKLTAVAAAAAADDSTKPITELPINTTEAPTEKPKVRKISHVFQTHSTSRMVPDAPVLLNEAVGNNNNNKDDDGAVDSAVNRRNASLDAEELLQNIAKDKAFLASMTIVHTPWQQSLSVQFIYSFPFISELAAVIWTAMCLIYQAGIKKYWGLPKPWRIVVPSIIVFTLMSIGSLAYMVLANGFLRHFCRQLRGELANPNALGCGQAMHVMRPVLVRHDLDTDVYFIMFRITYVLSFVMWVLALLVMVLRYVFAVDFQLVDVQTIFERHSGGGGVTRECTEEELLYVQSPQSQRQRHSSYASQSEPSKLLLPVEGSHKSEDDYQSAKSHMSEIASTPLLDEQSQAKIT